MGTGAMVIRGIVIISTVLAVAGMATAMPAVIAAAVSSGFVLECEKWAPGFSRAFFCW
jgi:hypothetical protein